jgi:hypothetical protein
MVKIGEMGILSLGENFYGVAKDFLFFVLFLVGL